MLLAIEILGIAIMVQVLVWATDRFVDWMAWRIVCWRHKDLVKENIKLMNEVNATIERIQRRR